MKINKGTLPFQGKITHGLEPRSERIRAPLFRPEAIGPKPVELAGSISLSQSWSSWTLIILVAATFMAAALYTYVGRYSKKSSATGVLLPESGIVRIQSPIVGVTREVRVSEGQFVEKNQVLFIVSEDKRIAGMTSNPLLAESQRKLLDSRRSSLHSIIQTIRLAGDANRSNLQVRMKALEEQLLRNGEEIDLLKRRATSAADMLARYKNLFDQNFASRMQLLEREEQLLAIENQLLSAKRQSAELRSSSINVANEIKQNDARTELQIVEFQREESSLSQQAADLQSREAEAIVAPSSGFITSVNAVVGKTTSSAPLAVLLPSGGQLVAQILVSSKDIGLTNLKQKVNLRFRAYPYQKYGQHRGEIFEISQSPLAASEVEEKIFITDGSNVGKNEGFYKIKIRLDGDFFGSDGVPLRLLPGMAFDADILHDKRRIIEWIFEPVQTAGRFIG